VPLLLNNCRGRPHSKIYGPDAFYDVDAAADDQVASVRALAPGDACVVASKSAGSDVVLVRYKFAKSATERDDQGDPCVVLYGSFVATETMTKSAAAASAAYQGFFDKNGNFKRRSVLSI
jgi:hypothetical protein